jgi:hypothetical protein
MNEYAPTASALPKLPPRPCTTAVCPARRPVTVPVIVIGGLASAQVKASKVAPSLSAR